MTRYDARPEETTISLEARLSFVDRARSNAAQLNAKAIAESIGTYDRWVYRTVEDLGIQSEPGMVGGVEVAVYPPWTTDVLREELHWREHIRELPDRLGIDEMAESLGRSYGWTQKTLEKIRAEPVQKSGALKYNKRSLQELRHVCMAVPLDDGWYNLGQLVQLTGQDREWIERRITEAGYEPMDRRSALTGKIHGYFPPEVLDVVIGMMAERAAAAGEWMTVNGMAIRLGRNEKWVARRIGQYEALSEPRQDDNGVTRTHYPPSVFTELESESTRNRQLPMRGDHLNIHQIARLTGHGTEWAKEKLVLLGIEPELLQDEKGRAQLSFPRSTAQLLIDYEKDNPEQENLITSKDIWNMQVAVGSLRSQIRLKRELDRVLGQNGVPATDSDRQTIRNDITVLRRELKLASQRLDRLEAKSNND